MKIKIIVGTKEFTATLNNNETSKELVKILPMTINMSELNRNEKYHQLSQSLPTDAINMEAIQNGDLMLYSTNMLVIFYKTFSTFFSYTRIGKIENPVGLQEALGQKNVEVKFEMTKKK